MSTATLERTEVPVSAIDFRPCVTQDAERKGIAHPDFLEVCVVVADLVAQTTWCEITGCDGHPICQPCFDLGVERGVINGPAQEPL